MVALLAQGEEPAERWRWWAAVPEVLPVVRRCFREFAWRYCPDVETLDELELCLGEAVTNAIVHGAARVAGGRVGVGYGWDGAGMVWIEVADVGPGFDPGALEEPEPLEPGGRGVGLMAAFAQVTYGFPVEGGTVVRLERVVRERG